MNITCAILFGDRYELDNKEFLDILKFVHLINVAYGTREIISFYPFLRILPIFKSLKVAREAIALRDPILDRKVQEHVDTYDPDNIRDFTDSLIKFSKSHEADEGANYTQDDIAMVLYDFVFAGVDTGLHSISFALLYLIHSPEYQDKIYQEMCDVLGVGVYPTLRDRGRLPMYEATVMEILRHSSVAALGVPHRVLQNVKIGDQQIPKNTYVLFNIWAINHDQRHWKKPEEFYPERWLNEDGEVLSGVKQSYLSFGAGRRNCVGEALAKAELFLVLGRMIVDFEFQVPDGNDLPSLEPEVDLLLQPKPFSMKFVQRRP